MMKEKGMKGSIMAVSDPDSEEARVAVEYIEYHKKLPKSYPHVSEKEINWAKKTLFSPEAKLEEKKKSLIILAHLDRLDAYKTLEKYEARADPALKIWVNMAIQECQSFLKSDILEKPVISVSQVSKVGRNEPCPCGSKKKYKKCHGK